MSESNALDPHSSNLKGIGVPRDKVVLVAYQKSWERQFEQEKQRLLEACGERLAAVEHVGSTAIPGLLSKPLLDIAIALASFEDGKEVVSCIARLGYGYLGAHGIPGRFYFVLRDKGCSLAHLHMYQQNHPDLRDLIAFKTHLLRHPEALEAYAELKRELYAKYRDDRSSYTSAKGAFIQSVLLKARQGQKKAL